MALVPRLVGRLPHAAAPCRAIMLCSASGCQRLMQPGACVASRAFCAAPNAVDTRVVAAVRGYLQARSDELRREGGAEDKVKALGGEVLTSSTWTDLGLDELDTVEVLLEVEKEFGREMPDAVSESVSSVADVIKYFETQV
eukprot:gnl/TRDRNA2_/TRDRNA2_189206_c0_seq1.p3 gnl/TRDRNA2_/TRDRNA2_189206_c0~~gnl/TRDRNA2_/TRDRNA2_189206_c0_seq1.p3  ORF type:complete len:160 (+),score=25.34 gnl/TRDRNA2_/TRDRNA2_189206_c0_seq1:58-480(+)